MDSNLKKLFYAAEEQQITSSAIYLEIDKALAALKDYPEQCTATFWSDIKSKDSAPNREELLDYLVSRFDPSERI